MPVKEKTYWLFPFLTIWALILALTCMYSCKKEARVTGIDEKLVIEISEGFVKDKVWVVVHTLDGSGIYDLRVTVTGTTFDFGRIVSGVATFTVISYQPRDPPHTLKDHYLLETYYYAPLGRYYFNGEESCPTYEAIQLEMTYPAGQYDNWLLSLNNLSEGLNGTVPGNGNIQTYLDPPCDPSMDNFSLFGAVWKEGDGYCNWKLGLDPQGIGSDKIDLLLTEPLQSMNIHVNLPFNFINLNYYFNDRTSCLNGGIFQYPATPTQTVTLLYPVSMPVEDYHFTIGNDLGTVSSHLSAYVMYDFFVTDYDYPPGDISLPELHFVTDFDAQKSTFTLGPQEMYPHVVRANYGRSDSERTFNWDIYMFVPGTESMTFGKPGLDYDINYHGVMRDLPARRIEFLTYDNVNDYHHYFRKRFMEEPFSVDYEVMYCYWLSVER